MKALSIYSLLFLAFCVSIARAQQSGLVDDQNPRYAESRNHYMKAADSLTSEQGTTVQQTYKAYDWYQARLERREQRREWRRQEYMDGGYYYNNYWPGYYNPYTWGTSRYWFIPSISLDYHWGGSHRHWH